MADTPEDLTAHFKSLSSLGAKRGGEARANTLTQEERSSIARQAARARWQKREPAQERSESATATPKRVPEIIEDRTRPGLMPFSMFKGNLKIADLTIECHVLNDGRRVFTQMEILRVLTGGADTGNLNRYLSRNPLYDNTLASRTGFQFKIPGTNAIGIGREATDLIEICETYLEARDQKLLKSGQLKLAAQAEIIIRACAKVGIIALIDEATGYQQVRARNALQLKLQAFIADELQEWAKMFPDEFWFELARLEGIHYSPRSRPLRWGKYVMMFVYDAIDGDVGKELRKKNPDPHFKQNHHQWLKQFGRDKVNNQLQRVITIMKLCDDMDDFRKKFAKVFQKSPLQMSFEDMWQ